jgi:predicted naringenin-chalcone synthase
MDLAGVTAAAAGAAFAAVVCAELCVLHRSTAMK